MIATVGSVDNGGSAAVGRLRMLTRASLYAPRPRAARSAARRMRSIASP
jgi:hypothetical protein